MSMTGHTTGDDGLRRLVLTGFMGAGKTTVGHLLADKLGWRFADLDASIEEVHGLPVSAIFAEHGETAFRAAELETLRTLLAGSRVVIALGGGAPETPGLRDLLAGSPETVVVHLHAPIGVLYDRCLHQAESGQAALRPLLGSLEEAAARLLQRETLYREVATLEIDTEGLGPEEVAGRILADLGDAVLPI